MGVAHCSSRRPSRGQRWNLVAFIKSQPLAVIGCRLYKILKGQKHPNTTKYHQNKKIQAEGISADTDTSTHFQWSKVIVQSRYLCMCLCIVLFFRRFLLIMPLTWMCVCLSRFSGSASTLNTRWRRRITETLVLSFSTTVRWSNTVSAYFLQSLQVSEGQEGMQMMIIFVID